MSLHPPLSGRGLMIWPGWRARPFSCGMSCCGFLDFVRPSLSFRLGLRGALGGGRVVSRADAQPGTSDQAEHLDVEIVCRPTLFPQVARNASLATPLRKGRLDVRFSDRHIRARNLL